MNIYKNIKKAFQFGPRKTSSIVINRLKTNFFEQYSRRRALQMKAGFSWHSFCKKFKVSQDFSVFFAQIKKKELSCIDQLLLDNSQIIVQADEFAKNSFNFLGSGNVSFNKILWHEDFRLKKQNTSRDTLFNSKAYYKDIIIKPGSTDQLEKDIKLPWELSRFAHLIILGQAYRKTGDKKYNKAFKLQLSDWLDENPYLLGPNWVCPMDVGIRAINWIIGVQYFKNAEIDELFWKRLVCSLYDHMIYLENNWEIYDSITSNHYLSDLIGYFYLCWFFSDLKDVAQKSSWCYQEILKEFEKQVFDEGTDYESSTNYHVLITELFYHFYLLAPELGFVLPSNFTKKFHKMFSFIDWCTPFKGNLIQIGDNDSGKIVTGISSKLINEMKSEESVGIKHFLDFGISILKTKKMHLSLRHHAYQVHQPTAHFHNDAGSLTLAINGSAIFVDPGSYVYTPSAIWRNHFRSVAVHNTFFIEGQEPVALHDNRLFGLDLPEHQPTVEGSEKLYSSHDLYSPYGLRAHRLLSFEQNQELTITDCWEKIGNTNQKNILATTWNFTLGPTIDLKKTDNGWLLLHENSEIVQLESALLFEVAEGFYSPSYGTKLDCKRLVAQKILNFEEATIRLKF